MMVGSLLGACAVDAESSGPQDEQDEQDELEEQGRLDLETVERGTAEEADVCGLASDLSRDNVCSLLCDPEGFQARLLHDGMSGGRCYQFRCDLGADTVVSIGMCLP